MKLIRCVLKTIWQRHWEGFFDFFWFVLLCAAITGLYLLGRSAWIWLSARFGEEAFDLFVFLVIVAIAAIIVIRLLGKGVLGLADIVRECREKERCSGQ